MFRLFNMRYVCLMGWLVSIFNFAKQYVVASVLTQLVEREKRVRELEQRVHPKH